MVIRERERVRLLTKGGLDRADRYPWIVETARKLKQGQFVLDGEAVVHQCRRDSRTSPRCSLAATINEAQFYAFDMLAGEGDDYRRLPLSMRKTNLARLLARRVDGIHLAPFEQGNRPIYSATPV